jgi:hypothetical protein
MKKIIKNILIITPAIFFLACGDNTETVVVKDVTSVQIDDTNISIYSTDLSRQLTATVTYTDSTTASITNPEYWTNSDYDALSMYGGSITASSNGGSSIVGISVGRFSDERNVTIIELTDFNISNPDINTTGEHILEATGTFEDNTSKVIETNIVWTTTNGATITYDENYVATINILAGDTNVTATVFQETNTSAPILAPITKTYSIN